MSSDQNICLCVQHSDYSEERTAKLRMDQGSDQNSENRRNPITDLLIVLEKDDDVVPVGYEQIGSVDGRSVIFVGKSNSNERARLYCRRSFDSPPISDVSLVLSSKGEKPTQDLLIVSSSPCGYPTELVGYGKGVVMHLGYRQNLSHLIFPDGLPPKTSSISGNAPKFSKRPQSMSLGGLPSDNGMGAMKVTSLSSFSLGSISLHNAAVATCNILCPFIVGMYTSDSTLIETSINGLIHCVKHSPFLFDKRKSKTTLAIFAIL